jgi:hypothetical protein
LVSQLSPGSTTPFPHEAEQSSSLFALQPAGQQPSPSAHWETEEWLQEAEQVPPLSSVSVVQGFLSSQLVGQAPGWPAGMPVSQPSLSSSTPFPHEGEQSASLTALQPAGQQPSPPVHWETGAWLQEAEQVPPLIRVSVVQGFLSSQLVGQAPGWPVGILVSQLSLGSSTPFPHEAEQSLSLFALQPVGQQPSPPTHWDTGEWLQEAEQLPPLSRMSFVQGFLSSQSVGQAPGWPAGILVSQLSLGSSFPSPQELEQSLSPPAWVQPAGQQPSAGLHAVIGACVQEAEQVPPLESRSSVQEFLSSQLTGQEPGWPPAIWVSQVSPGSSFPLPQLSIGWSEPASAGLSLSGWEGPPLLLLHPARIRRHKRVREGRKGHLSGGRPLQRYASPARSFRLGCG